MIAFALIVADGHSIDGAKLDVFAARVGCDLTVSRVNREGARIVRSATR